MGKITAAHGIRGAVKLRAFTQNPEHIFDYALHDAHGTPYRLQQIGEHKQQFICVVENITTRAAAESLKGLELGVYREALPTAELDEPYIMDMIGLRVVLSDGNSFGTISAIHNYGAGDIVEITTSTQPPEQRLFSFDHQTFSEIDSEQRCIILYPPEEI